jgi:hypothetical protein
MKRLLLPALLLGLGLAVGRADSADKRDSLVEGLRDLNVFIGKWKGTGGPDKIRPAPGDPIWSEDLNWAWRFRKDDAYLVLEIKKGKHLKGGELHYLPEKERFRFIGRTADDREQTFEGKFSERSNTLTLERVDPKTKETQQLRMTSAGDGVRFIYRFRHKAGGSTLWKKDYMVAASKEGESLALKKKMIECVVTGGLGTMPITYKGMTYYVCCSGCAEAFRENPEKFIAEYNARKKKR